MNDQLSILLADLAEQLGTTTEMLWGVLIRQAQIQAYILIFKIVLFWSVGFGVWKAHCSFMKDSGSSRFKSYYEHYDPFSYLVMGILGLFCFFLFGASIVAIRELLTALFNPEYWALKEILWHL